jgi:hypothetical protein
MPCLADSDIGPQPPHGKLSDFVERVKQMMDSQSRGTALLKRSVYAFCWSWPLVDEIYTDTAAHAPVHVIASANSFLIVIVVIFPLQY